MTRWFDGLPRPTSGDQLSLFMLTQRPRYVVHGRQLILTQHEWRFDLYGFEVGLAELAQRRWVGGCLLHPLSRQNDYAGV